MSRIETEPEQPAPSANGKLTIWTPSQFLAYEDDPQDILLENGYLEKGSPVAFCGPPGIGKSRLIMQLAITSILGAAFLGWRTNAANLRWLILQNENGNRRIKSEYEAMLGAMTFEDRKKLDEALFMAAIVSDIDGDLNLADSAVYKRVREAVGDFKPDLVVGDPLTALTSEDLNSDQAMLSAARTFGRVARVDNMKAVPVLIHHARTGKAAQEGMSGADRASFARNSKALYGFIRSQINMGPVEEKKNDRLFFASGKCNNFREFDEIIIELDHATRFYLKTSENADEVRDNRRDGHGGRPNKFHAKDLQKYLRRDESRPKADVKLEVCMKHSISTKTFDRHWNDAIEFGLIEEDSNNNGIWVAK
jgi:RecA-family ATPase